MKLAFERIRIGERAINLSEGIYNLTRSFPKKDWEVYLFSSQVKKAADFLAFDLRDKLLAGNRPELKRCLCDATSAAIDIATCLYVGKCRRLVSNADFRNFYGEAQRIMRMLRRLQKRA